MCESNAYLKDGEHEIMLMEAVDSIQPCGSGLKLIDIFGKEFLIKAKIKNMSLLNHRIILEKTSIESGK